MSDIVERLREKSEWTNQRPYFHAHDKCIEAAAEIIRLHAERDALLIALHDAIRRPMGVVPASADPFYSPAMADQAEAIRALMSPKPPIL